MPVNTAAANLIPPEITEALACAIPLTTFAMMSTTLTSVADPPKSDFMTVHFSTPSTPVSLDRGAAIDFI